MRRCWLEETEEVALAKCCCMNGRVAPAKIGIRLHSDVVSFCTKDILSRLYAAITVLLLIGSAAHAQQQVELKFALFFSDAELRFNNIGTRTAAGQDIALKRLDFLVSRVALMPDNPGGPRIDTTGIEGPFRKLSNRWVFHPHPEGSFVDFELEFEFRSLLLQQTVRLLFAEAVKRMVSAFEARANQLYGKPMPRQATPASSTR